MTTVIADLRYGVMVADSKISDGEVKGTMQKIFVSPRAVIGIAGDTANAYEFVRWYNDRRRRKPAPLEKGHEDGWDALVWTLKGLEFWDDSMVPSDHSVNHTGVVKGVYAIGSGATAALAAIAAGCTAPEAVAIACGIDDGSGFPVVTELLKLEKRDG